MSIKVIFLDIDGVLNNEYSRTRCGQGRCVGIDEDKLKLLETIIDATDAKVVLSSSWRIGINKDGEELENHQKYMYRKFKKAHIDIYDMTPVIRRGYARGEEIATWLKQHPEVYSWVVLDDEWFHDFGEYSIEPHLVQTSFYGKDGGLQPKHVVEAVDILNPSPEDAYDRYWQYEEGLN